MQEVFKMLPDSVKCGLIIVFGAAWFLGGFSQFLSGRQPGHLAMGFLGMLFLFAGIFWATHFGPAKASETVNVEPVTTRMPPTPSVSVHASGTLQPADIEQGLQLRARSAANFLMTNLQKTQDLRGTVAAVRDAELIKQPDNLTTPYIGRVVVEVTDANLGYSGTLHLNFEYQRTGWRLVDVQPTDYLARDAGQVARVGRISTKDALPFLMETQTQWMMNWKMAWALGKTPEQQ